jgi:hypothetical protein
VAVCVEVARELGLSHEDVKVRVSDRRLLNAVLAAIGMEDSQLPIVWWYRDMPELTEALSALASRITTDRHDVIPSCRAIGGEDLAQHATN